ncbi:MAG TPA: gamma-glutamylcyclotransferase [Candidatus Binatia bacterium]|nr:gamma-glutamylcyclotransferase [Candidatus Binatia bacterium]
MAADLTWYFAYGSNMQRATFRERRALSPAEVSVGWLEGYALCFDIPVGPGLRGVANLARADDSRVWGVLYLLNAEQHAHLDRTEGVSAGVYRRMLVPIQTQYGSTVEAETYISELRDPARRPSHRYLSLLLDGARENALPDGYIHALEKWDLAWDERDGAFNPPELRPQPQNSSS